VLAWWARHPWIVWWATLAVLAAGGLALAPAGRRHPAAQPLAAAGLVAAWLIALSSFARGLLVSWRRSRRRGAAILALALAAAVAAIPLLERAAPRP
jgi:hypothetical protein